MHEYQREFIRFALDRNVLRFGEFTLKSGRKSPYFFNAGLFNDGASLSRLGRFYAQALVHSSLPDVDVIFGPAYKGIPLAAVTAVALADSFDRNLPYCFNRKEAKDHGEGGSLVGAPLEGRALVIDDVITAGTAIREVAELFERTEASIAGVFVAVDRQERGSGESSARGRGLSAIQEVQESLGVPVRSIVSMSDIIVWLEEQEGRDADRVALKQYRKRYGVEG